MPNMGYMVTHGPWPSKQSGACFRATNVFSFEALFANNPFWCLKWKHVSYSRLGKTQPSHGVGYRKS